MAEQKAKRLSKIAREFNVGISTIVDFLNSKGVEVSSNPNSKVAPEAYEMLSQEYSSDINIKKESQKLVEEKKKSESKSASVADNDEEEENVDAEIEDEVTVKDQTGGFKKAAKKDVQDIEKVGPASKVTPKEPVKKEVAQEDETSEEDQELKVVGKIDLDSLNQKTRPDKKKKGQTTKEKEETAKKTEPKSKATPKAKPEAKPEAKAKSEPEAESKPKPKEEPAEKPAEEQKTEKSKEQKEETAKVDESTEQTSPETPATEPAETEITAESETSAESEDTAPAETEEVPEKEAENDNYIGYEVEKLNTPTVVGKIVLNEKDYKKKPKSKKVASSAETEEEKNKRKRKRIRKEKKPVDVKAKEQNKTGTATKDKEAPKEDAKSKTVRKKKKKVVQPKNEVSEEEVDKKLKDTLARLQNKGKSKGVKYRREKRDAIRQNQEEENERMEQEKAIIRVTEFVSVNELASIMEVDVNKVISACMSLGLFVSINQRLDAETISIVADEFGYQTEFTTVEAQESIVEEEEDDEKDMQTRPPVVTVMGHVDHGKTKLLDYVRRANVIAGEAGGITQHIGAYNVTLPNEQKITFLDTPGHEAFTAMRARGAQITDVAIIVIAADDGVKPQTKEAINHAQAANVPIVFAINKVDKPNSNPDRIKEQLAEMNLLVEDWGGKYQSQEISALNGIKIEELLEKVILESELLDLKANPERKAQGTIIESSLDKGRGYVATLIVEKGSLKIGDVVLAGSYTGRVKAMYNERNQKIDHAGPAMPALLLGLDGAPQAGDKFHVMENDKEARDIAIKRQQLQREQGLRAKKHITLDEIGRRIAIGNFQELNVIVKADVDGSVEALADSIVKLSTEEIQVNIIHKGVGQISESDILLAAASDAVVIGFQVRPSLAAKRIAEKEEIEMRLYSIIYDAIDEMRSAMEGMLTPEIKEEVVANLEVLETFKITKVGTIAGCMVKDGKITKDAKVRLIRDGIVVYTGELGSLKRYKDDVKEVVSGIECGLDIKNYNDIKVGDIIEAFKETEVKKTL